MTYSISPTVPTPRILEQGGEKEGDSHCSPVAFTVELRPQDTSDGGSVGFMVPTEQVQL